MTFGTLFFPPLAGGKSATRKCQPQKTASKSEGTVPAAEGKQKQRNFQDINPRSTILFTVKACTAGGLVRIFESTFCIAELCDIRTQKLYSLQLNFYL